MDLAELNNKFQELDSKCRYPTGNTYLMLVEKDFIVRYSDWFMLWGRHQHGYYEIAGNMVYVIESTLNKLVDITKQLEK